MAFFRKKTPAFEAIQWRGDNLEEVKKFVGPVAFEIPSETPDGLPMTLAIRQHGTFFEVVKDEWIYKSGDGFSTKSDESIKNNHEEIQP